MCFLFFGALCAVSYNSCKTIKCIKMEDRRFLKTYFFNKGTCLSSYYTHKLAVFVLQIINKNRADLRNYLFRAFFELLAGLCDELSILLYVLFIFAEWLWCVEDVVVRECKRHYRSGEDWYHTVSVFNRNRDTWKYQSIRYCYVLVLFIGGIEINVYADHT